MIETIAPDIAVVIAYGQLIPKEIYLLPEFNTINVHFSLLPEYRGAAPVQRAIENGASETGVTVFRIDVGVDTGNIVLQKREPIYSSDTTPTLYKRLSELGGLAITEAIRYISAEKYDLSEAKDGFGEEGEDTHDGDDDDSSDDDFGGMDSEMDSDVDSEMEEESLYEIELDESALKGLSKPKKVEAKESALKGLSKPKKVEAKESALSGLSKPKKVEPKEEALAGLKNPKKVEAKEETEEVETEVDEAARTFGNDVRKPANQGKKYKAGRHEMNEEVENLKKQNAEYKKALVLFKDKLNEVAVFNANLAYATRLFTEHSTTKQEKLTILKRFDGISTLSEAKNLFSQIKTELGTKTNVTESVVEKISNAPSTSSSQEVLSESKAYENPQFKRMKDLMSKIK